DASLFMTLEPNHPMVQMPGVVGLGYLAPAALAEAYGLADALVMPSIVETVGLPMLEAMHLGTPVVAADRPYAHDICGDAATYFDPGSPDDLQLAVSAVLSDERRRRSMLEASARLIAQRSNHKPYGRMIELLLSAKGPAKGARARRIR